MKTLKEKITFWISGILCFLFNLRIGKSLPENIMATFWQLILILGFTILAVVFLQYMAEGKKMPWVNRFRLFFAVGIIMGLIFAIWEYTGTSYSM